MYSKMEVRKQAPLCDAATAVGVPSAIMPSLVRRTNEEADLDGAVKRVDIPTEEDVDIDLREVYFLIMHFLSGGPCHRTFGQLWNELLEHKLLPRRYHAWYSRSGSHSGNENDDGLSFPLSYAQLVERYPHTEKNHLVKLLQQLLLKSSAVSSGVPDAKNLTGADVPTLLGSGAFSLLESERGRDAKQVCQGENYLRWPHLQSNQVHGLSLREIGGGFAKHHRAPSVRAACYAIAKPSTLLQKIQIIKKLRGHQNAVYCAIFDRSGQYVITGSDDRLVKIWSMETGFCLSSCRGHEGDITDLAVSANNALVASASNDCIIRVWRLPDGLPISVLRGHTGAVTAIAFSPRPGCEHHLLSSSDDGTCRIWDARDFHINPRVYSPKPEENTAGAKANGAKVNDPAQFSGQRGNQILCCAFNANGTIFVTGSSDTLARVWSACRRSDEVVSQPNHELDILAGHENDVNYVQFSGSAVPARSFSADSTKEENFPKFKNSWFTHDNIVTCSRDGSAIIWIPRSRRYHGRVGRWTRAYHLKVPPPPMPPQPPRGGPRQRLLPTPRGVNMIVWSLDNRFVLAAIMDCRICVWNAVDGSLVHSLTGHTESTYVLDVHPFNPRIAMSAGYDGKTIIWDIWEGVPIRIYETGHFKLVDGKFSPDGTSIVLSDEVGQIYILATGQGESQKDAKYDQFFLGDYRPLVQDVHGNVLDQETQLPPYRRNIQDLLCDANMIPYPDPYQSMYQQRRLGALGIDWQPPSVRLAVGTTEDGIYAIQDDLLGQLPTTHIEGDRDRWLEQPTELEDVMDWEQENDAQSDDTGSEYNITEEGTSEGEQGSLNASSSEETECSVDEDENSKDEDSSKAHLRRSKRKKRKAEGAMFTSSGRRVKKKYAEESDGTRGRIKKYKYSRHGKSMKKKIVSEKSSRPQRLAARNALNLFSRISASSSRDEDSSASDSESQGSGYSHAEENALSSESQRSLSGEQKGLLEEETSQNDLVPMTKQSEHVECNKHEESNKPEDFNKQPRSGKIVLKFQRRDFNSDVQGKASSPSVEVHYKDEKQEDALVNSLDISEAKISDKFYLEPTDTTYVPKVSWPEEHDYEVNQALDQSRNALEHHRDLSWGDVKARRSKRLRVTDANPVDFSVKTKLMGNNSNAQNFRQQSNAMQSSNGQSPQLGIMEQVIGNESSQSGQEDHHADILYKQPQNISAVSVYEKLDTRGHTDFTPERRKSKSFVGYRGILPENNYVEKVCDSPTSGNGSGMEGSWREGEGCSSDKYETGVLKHVADNILGQSEMAETVADNGEDAALFLDNNYSCEAAEPNYNRFGKFMSRTRTKKDSCTVSHEQNHIISEEWKNFGNNRTLQGSRPRDDLSGRFTFRASGTRAKGHSVQQIDWSNEEDKLEYYNDGKKGDFGLNEPVRIDTDSDDRVQNAEDEKRQAFGANMLVDGENSSGMGNSSNEDKKMPKITLKLHPMTADHGRKARSERIKRAGRTTQETASTHKHYGIYEGLNYEEKQTQVHPDGLEGRESLIGAEWGSTSRVLNGVRPARNRRSTGYNNGRIPVEKKKGKQVMRKLSWLMLAEAEECNRYIPQFGDHVAYLRQGHQEYLEMKMSREMRTPQDRGPWKTIKGTIRSVEFCHVENLEYSTFAGSGETCCKLTLKFIGQDSDVYGKSFKLTLPELTNFPDFLVEKSRYEAALKRNWTHRDRCHVWWRSEGGEGGSWWAGRVTNVEPKSSDFPDSPWDRYVVQYKSDSSGPHKHSPWELFDPNNHSLELPKIDPAVKTQFLRGISNLEQISYENDDCYGLLKLSEASEKSDFHNRNPLPLSLDIITRRLENYYYRSVEAFGHDLNQMVVNAKSYFGKDASMTLKLQRLADRLSEVLLLES